MIRQKVLGSIVIHADETEVRLLKPRRGKTITGYVSGYAGDAGHPFVFYDSYEGEKRVRGRSAFQRFNT